MANGADPSHAWARHYYALHDTSFNVIGLVEGDFGRLVERYEYTPYGERLVFSHGCGLLADINRDGVVNPADLGAMTAKWNQTAGVNDYEDMDGDGYVNPNDNAILTLQWMKTDDTYADDPGVMYPRLASLDGPAYENTAFPLNEFGHQGLMHDETTGLIYNRARFRNDSRFLQRDPLGYPDGMNTYAGYHVTYGGYDPYGLSSNREEALELNRQKHAEIQELISKLDKLVDSDVISECAAATYLYGKIYELEQEDPGLKTLLYANGQWTFGRSLRSGANSMAINTAMHYMTDHSLTNSTPGITTKLGEPRDESQRSANRPDWLADHGGQGASEGYVQFAGDSDTTGRLDHLMVASRAKDIGGPLPDWLGYTKDSSPTDEYVNTKVADWLLNAPNKAINGDDMSRGLFNMLCDESRSKDCVKGPLTDAKVDDLLSELELGGFGGM